MDVEMLKGADKKYGYKFGCDGLMSIEEACQTLGNVCDETIYQRCRDGLLRKGKHPGGRRVGICRRSMTEYLSKMEV